MGSFKKEKETKSFYVFYLFQLTRQYNSLLVNAVVTTNVTQSLIYTTTTTKQKGL